MTKVTYHLACLPCDYAVFCDTVLLADLMQRLFLLVAEGSYHVMKFLRQKKKKKSVGSLLELGVPLGTISSVHFSRSVMSDSLQPQELQHPRPPCPSPPPGVHPNPCPMSWWCHLTISSSVVPFSSSPQSLPASGSFPMSQLFAWGGQSIGVSALASVLPMKTQDWSPLGWLVGSPWVQGTLKSLLQHHSSKASILQCSGFFIVKFSHPYMTTGKTISLTRWTFVGKVMSPLSNMLSRLVITFFQGASVF